MLQESLPQADQAAVARRGARRGRGILRRPAAAVFALGAWVLPTLGIDGSGSALALLLLGALLATGLAGDGAGGSTRLSWLEWLPAAVLLAVLCATALGLLGATVGVSLWGSRTAALALWSTLVLAALAVVLRRPGRIAIAPDTCVQWLATVPFVVVGAALLLQPFEVWARIVNLGTDFARHAYMVLQGTTTGWLDYSSSPYPRSAHTSLALLQSAAAGTDYASAWQATQTLLLLFFALIAASSVLLAARVAGSIIRPGATARFIVPLIALVAALVGPWMKDMMHSGFLTSFQAGAILGAAALLLFDGRRTPTRAIVAGLFGLTALMAHTWILLVPLVAVPAAWMSLPLLRPRFSAVPVVSAAVAAVVALPVVVASFSLSGISAAGTAGGTTLPQPGPVWMALLVLSCLGISALGRADRALTSQALMLLVLALVGVLALLVPFSGGGDNSYYLTKTAWTPFGVLVGLAVPATAMLALRVPRRVRFVGLAAVAVAAALVLPAAAGNAVDILRGRQGVPAIVIPLVQQLEERFGSAAQRPEVLVWGLLPYLDGDEASVRVAGRTDFIAQGALIFGGYPLSDTSNGDAFLNHDPAANCRYLQRFPAVVRVTGPYPAGPLQWLTDAGCPADAVRPDQWLSIDMDPSWFAGTKYEGIPYGSGYAPWSLAERITP